MVTALPLAKPIPGVVLVRDPVGEAYGITLYDYAHLWRYLMGVVQEQR